MEGNITPSTSLIDQIGRFFGYCGWPSTSNIWMFLLLPTLIDQFEVICKLILFHEQVHSTSFIA
jgi:hypothetical protein